jgi:mRNA-degrading endonuclease RelE of RelBE toxin-antitoxin system
MAYEVDSRVVAQVLESMPTSARLQVELKLRAVAKFADLTPPPSMAFLLFWGIDPSTVFRFEVAGYRVDYEVDPDALVVRVMRVRRQSAAAETA